MSRQSLHASRWLGISLLLAPLVATSCLFSTTPPRRSNPGDGPPADPNRAVVTGLVRLHDRTDNHYTSGPDRPIQATWFHDPNGDRRLDVLTITYSYSRRDGSYEASFSYPGILACELQTLLCNYNPDDVECCLDNPPCSPCQVWTPIRHVAVQAGQHAVEELIVQCDHAP